MLILLSAFAYLAVAAINLLRQALADSNSVTRPSMTVSHLAVSSSWGNEKEAPLTYENTLNFGDLGGGLRKKLNGLYKCRTEIVSLIHKQKRS